MLRIAWPAPDYAQVIRPTDWNELLVTVEGNHMVAVLNGDMIGRNHPDTASILGVQPPHRNSSALVQMALERRPLDQGEFPHASVRIQRGHGAADLGWRHQRNEEQP